MIGTIYSGGAVPLHSHADVESFYILSGSVQVWREREGDQWTEVIEGQFVHVPGNAKHAFRNPSKEPVREIIITTPRLGRFFESAGRPISAGSAIPSPTAADVERFLRISAEYGYWNASPEENTRIGINVQELIRETSK